MVLDAIDIRRGEVPRWPDGASWRGTPFQTERWLTAWLAGFGTDRQAEPITVIGRCGGTEAFILPLALERRKGVRILVPLGIHHSDYGAPMLNAVCATALAGIDGTALLKETASRIGGVDAVYLAKQPKIIGGMANPFVLPGHFEHHAGAHAIHFTPGQSFEDFLFTRRSSKTRRRLREKRSALEKSGAITFRLAQTADEARVLVAACLAAKSAQLIRQGHWDPFSEKANRDFLVEFFSGDLGATTWAAALDVGGRLAVTSFGFRIGGDWLLYQMAMEEDADAKNSPGTHHLLELIRHCTEVGADVLDLSLGDESYKSEWCDSHERLAVSVLPITAKGRVVAKIIETRGKTRLRMAADPVLYERAKRIKGFLRVFKLPL